MNEILRGQQGFPTGPGRAPAGPVDREALPELPSRADWRRPAQAEAAVEAVRDALAARRSDGQPRAADPQPDLVREAEQIEEEVAPGREPGDDEPPTSESAND
jgi:hypothetical protein